MSLDIVKFTKITHFFSSLRHGSTDFCKKDHFLVSRLTIAFVKFDQISYIMLFEYFSGRYPSKCEKKVPFLMMIWSYKASCKFSTTIKNNGKIKPETHRTHFDARLAQLRRNATAKHFRNGTLHTNFYNLYCLYYYTSLISNS